MKQVSSHYPHKFTLPKVCPYHLGLLIIGCVLWLTTDGRAESIWAKIYNDAQAKAVEQIIASSQSEDAFLRANAIEASLALKDRVVPLTHVALSDPAPVVRFTALASIGKLRLTAVAAAARPLLNDQSASVRAAAIFALSRCGQDVQITPLAKMLVSQDPKLRGNAAMLVGLLGNQSAIPMLKDLVQTPMPRASAADEALARIQFAEALVRLGDTAALAPIRASAYSQFDEVRILAVSMMGRLADRRMEKAIAQHLHENPIELRIAAAEALARLRYYEGREVVQDALSSDIKTVRAQAAIAAEHFLEDQIAQAVVLLLDDTEEAVRLSAAATVIACTKPNHPD